MYTTTNTVRPGGIRTAFRRAEGWLDARGTWAWITAMVLGFIAFWPAGLALMVYMIWGKRMFSRSCSQGRHGNGHSHGRHGWGGHHALHMAPMTGNHAFDTYKADALRRLEEEQDAFESFLQRLRNSKDKTEFDAFMEERARSNAEGDSAFEASPVEANQASDATKPAGTNRPGEY